MASNPTTINGFELYPSKVTPVPMWIGGGVRRSLNGTARRKRVSVKQRIVLRWDVMTADEKAIADVIWVQAGADSVTIVNAEQGINGSFVFADPELKLEPLEGKPGRWAGVMTFEEV